ncbi:MAG: N-acetyl sugar amidotransferase, partial [Elusimicrobia bacterium]|nr:N-acetyl sugar amidotransferase [Elusimicrobiota bacterium]
MTKYIRYCRRCIMPETKPDLHFNEQGVCSACRHFESRKDVDWAQRKEELLRVLEDYRSKNGNNYDCVVGVSGGKDSTYQ